MFKVTQILLLLGLCLNLVAADGEQTKTGSLAARPADAATDVVAVLQSGGAEYHLVAAGAAVAQVQELLKKNARVQVTGPVNGDTMTVSAIKEASESTAVADAGNETGEMKKKKKDEKKKEKKKKKAEAN